MIDTINHIWSNCRNKKTGYLVITFVQNKKYIYEDVVLQNKVQACIIDTSAILKKLSSSWPIRAQVKRNDSYDQIMFDPNAADFREDLLPFYKHPIYRSASNEFKQKILSCGWIIYNQKTISIETEIVNPICIDILADRVPGLNHHYIKNIVSETMVDESYHVLLVTNSIGITSHMRNIHLPKYDLNLVCAMKQLQEKYTCNWKQKLIHLATCIVSEIFISDYLKTISEDSSIQKTNRTITKIHRDDELAHSNIFKNLTKNLYFHLTKREKIFFAKILAKPIRWFADKELGIWQKVLNQIGFDQGKMIEDCRNNPDNYLSYIDYSGLIQLANEIDLVDSQLLFDVVNETMPT